MSVTYLARDPWEAFIYRFVEMVGDGVEMKVSYDGAQAGVSLDRKALSKLGALFERGVPLEIALGIDLPKMLAGIEGEQLDITIKSKESEGYMRFRGKALEEFRSAMQHNPIDGEALRMLGKLLRRLTE